MAENFLSFKKLFIDFMINLFAGIFGGVFVGILYGNIWLGISISFLLLSILILILFLYRYRRFLKIIKSGVSGYYCTFDYSENYKVFAEPKKSFYYLGISANSIIEFFRDSIRKNPPLDNYIFLLMNPESPMLKRQIAFEKGISPEKDLSSLDHELQQKIESETVTEKKRIYSAIEVLKNFDIDKGKLKIHLHKNFIPWWMYIIDEKKIYLGILEKGIRGHQSPVLIMNRHPDFTSPFDAFKNIWDQMWADSTEA